MGIPVVDDYNIILRTASWLSQHPSLSDRLGFILNTEHNGYKLSLPAERTKRYLRVQAVQPALPEKQSEYLQQQITQARRKMAHSILGWIVIGIVAGWLTGLIMKGSGFGWLLDMVIGLIGAVIGGAIFRAIGYGGPGEHGLIVSILISTIGAVILTFLIHLFTGRKSAL